MENSKIIYWDDQVLKTQSPREGSSMTPKRRRVDSTSEAGRSLKATPVKGVLQIIKDSDRLTNEQIDVFAEIAYREKDCHIVIALTKTGETLSKSAAILCVQTVLDTFQRKDLSRKLLMLNKTILYELIQTQPLDARNLRTLSLPEVHQLVLFLHNKMTTVTLCPPGGALPDSGNHSEQFCYRTNSASCQRLCHFIQDLVAAQMTAIQAAGNDKLQKSLDKLKYAVAKRAEFEREKHSFIEFFTSLKSRKHIKHEESRAYEIKMLNL